MLRKLVEILGCKYGRYGGMMFVNYEDRIGLTTHSSGINTIGIQYFKYPKRVLLYFWNTSIWISLEKRCSTH